MRICSKCLIAKPLTEEFFRRAPYISNPLHRQCKVCDKVQRRESYLRNRDKEIAYANIRNSDKVSIRDYENNRYHTDPKIKVSVCMSTHIRVALKGKKAGRKWETLVGYTLEELIKHIESKFEPGMSWSNHSKFGWHIDHIIPKSSFKYTSTNDEEFKKCWALSNLQPLWAKENWSKHKRM